MRVAMGTVIISPKNNLAATTDNFQRVNLFDVLKGIAVRIIKSYPGAQIGLILSDESDQYLVIYSPTGLLEVSWS